MAKIIIVPRGWARQLTIMGWVSHTAGILTLTAALATENWLTRVSDGYHVGIFPCCPTFKCGESVLSRNEKPLESFINILIVGMLLIGLGWALSLAHSGIHWRSDERTFYGLSYLVSGLVTAGGIILAAGAIEFVVSVPGDMEGALKVSCPAQDNRIVTGFSYELFVAGATAFTLAGVLLFLGSCKKDSTELPSRCRSSNRLSIAVSEVSLKPPLETVHFCLGSFDNRLYTNLTEISLSDGHLQVQLFQQSTCPSQESLNELLPPHFATTETVNCGQHTEDNNNPCQKYPCKTANL